MAIVFMKFLLMLLPTDCMAKLIIIIDYLSEPLAKSEMYATHRHFIRRGAHLYARHFPKIVELGEKALPNKKEYLYLPNIKNVK